MTATAIERALCCGPTCGRPDPHQHGPCAAATYGGKKLSNLQTAGFAVLSHAAATDPLTAAAACPADILEWGSRHGIPNFAEATWQAGFVAGIRHARKTTRSESANG